MMTSKGVAAPACAAIPMSVEASAMIAATERSNSPEMMRSAIGSAMRPFSVKVKVRSESAQGSRK